MTSPTGSTEAQHPAEPDQDLRARATAIVADLSTEQCIELVSGRDFWTTRELAGVVPTVTMTNGPNGLGKQAADSDHVGLGEMVPATCFPATTVLASSWDVDLAAELGRALAREALAEDVSLLLGPGLNLKRHPRGGRNFEYFSEDPVQAGYMAAALVNGVQSQGVGACPKHFAANNQETMRMVVDELIDERTLREVYLRAFDIVVERCRPVAIMTAYNRVNGTWCSDHRWLLADVLRGEWGFDGLVVSDWGGTNDRVAGLRAGLDLEMPGNGGVYTPEIVEALKDGTLAESDLRSSAARVVEVALRGDAQRTRAPEPVDLDAHHALARRAAAAGTVLLTNDGLLPLDGTSGLALIGTFAGEPRYQGGGSARVTPTRLDVVRDALGSDLPYAPGYDLVSGESSADQLAEAVAIASAAERVVLVVGLPVAMEAETKDRPTARLPRSMVQLVDQVCLANPRTAVVLMNGGSLELDWADRPAAIVEAYLGGQAGGAALADVLLGAVEPGGRLAESFPTAVDVLPSDANFPGLPRQVQYREGQWIGYRFHDTFDTPARFPFGHGLGYTTWQIGDLSVGGDADRTANVTVTNTGHRPGATVVQAYLRAVDPTLRRPAKELAGFARVQLDTGESVRIDVQLESRLFQVWDTITGRWAVDGGEYEVLVGSSSVDIHDRVTIHIDSADVVNPVLHTAGPVATDAEFATLLGRPIPLAERSRPFSRNSTVAELSASRLGAVLATLIRRKMAKSLPPDDDGSMRDMLDNVIAGMPLRGMASLGQGLTPALLDRIVAALNGHWRPAIRGR